MSWYTYFYPKKEEYNPNNLSDNDLQKGINAYTDAIEQLKRKIKILMVQAYYGLDSAITTKIELNYKVLIKQYKYKDKYEWVQVINHELNEYQCVGINHAQCDNKFELEDRIESYKKSINNSLEDLLILASIRYKGDFDKEKEYLRYEYQSDIDEIFNNIEEIIEELGKNKFMLKYFHTKKTEGDLAEEENKDKD